MAHNMIGYSDTCAGGAGDGAAGDGVSCAL